MAKATKKTVEIEKIIKETQEVFVLELTKDEAEFLRALTGLHVTGSFDSPRKHSDSIYSTLVDMGLTGIGQSFGEGRVNFRDYPTETDDRPIRVGDRVRILIDGAECASVTRGDVLRVVDVYAGGIVTEGDWYFSESDSYERVND